MFAGLISPGSVSVDPFDRADAWILQGQDALVLAVESNGRGLFGWDHSAVLGMAAQGLIHPDDRSVMRQARHAARDGDGEHAALFRFRSSGDEWTWIDGRFVGVADVDGQRGSLSVLAMRTVSGPQLDRGALELTAELGSTFASASSNTEAWNTCLDRIARLTGTSAALVWQHSDAGMSVRHSWHDSPAGGRVVTARNDGSCSEPTLALGRAWTSGDVVDSNVDDVCSDSDLAHLVPGHQSLLIPSSAGSQTTWVVELVRPVDAPNRDLAVATLRGLSDTIARRDLEGELSPDELSFKLIFDEAAVGMAIIAVDGRFLAANGALGDFLGRAQVEFIGVSLQDLTFAPDLAEDDAVIADLLAGRLASHQFEKRFVHADGTVKWAMLSVSLVRRRGDPLHFIAQIVDIDGLKKAETELTRTMATFRAAFDHSGIGLALVQLDGDVPGLIVSANAAFADITRTTIERIVSRPLDEVVNPTGAEQIHERLQSALSDHQSTRRDEFRIDHAPHDSAWVRMVVTPVQDHEPGRRLVVVQMEDVTTERSATDQLSQLALHDPLTGLPNRLLIMDRIAAAQQRSERSGSRIGILFADLDKFKNVNDSFGHEAGDRLLREVANRFQAVLRPDDTAARLGGDEFVVLCEGLSAQSEAQAAAELERIADRLHECLRTPVLLESREVFVTISIGMNVVDDHTEDVHSLLSNADTAMYRAKARGRSRSETYDGTDRMEAIDRLRIDTELHHAIERDELTVVYQPIVALPSGAVRGAEALLRWHHPDLGRVRPDLFVDVAEDSELIVELGDFVMDQVGRHLSTHAPDDFYVTANVSARQLSRTDFVDTVERTLDRYRLDPRQLAVELTENVLMDAAGSSLSQLNSLRSLGVRVGVDDFGTGYASLTYLKQLPVSFVKIDRSFVSGLVHDPDDRTIADAVIGLAAALDLDVVAEGVETAKQAEILTELGCTFAQGYLFGRPAPPPTT